jgi:hypothetical protein
MHEHFQTENENRFQRNYLDLSKYLGGATGTWRPFGIALPDYQFTESAAGVGALPKTSTYVNPIFNNTSSGIANTPVTGAGTSAIPSSRVPLTTDTSGTRTTSLTEPEPAPTEDGSGIDFAALLDQQRQYADSLYNQARGQYDTGMKVLGEKRQGFTDIFNKGKEDILQGFEKGAGELQSSASGMATRNANALRAMGMGGSAVERAQGRQTQNNMKGLANLQDVRGTNEFQNQGAYNENNQWADTQEGGLNSFLQNADITRQGAQNNIVDNLYGLFQNIINSQTAYNASIGAKTDSPYAVNIPSMLNTITGALGDYGVMGGQDPNAGVSIPSNMTAEEYKKLMAQRAYTG